MNFFQRQDQARRKTRYLVIFYLLAVLCTVLAIHSIVTWVVMLVQEKLYWDVWCDPELLFLDSVILLLFIGGATLFKVSQLKSEGGDGIAAALGGTLVSPQTTDFQERRLLGIVEEMALASGIHVPNTYILKDEQGINAFAAGFTPAASVVAVTQGALDYLNRDELQGVIGHEFSHILNQDTNLNLRLIGVLFGLELLALIGIIIFRISSEALFWGSATRRNDKEESAGLAIAAGMFLIGLGVFLTGLIGQLFSNIIRAAISRQREFLADASSVQFTRNPDGLAGALKKIGSPNIGSKIQNSRSVQASHLFFSNIFSGNFLDHLFDTHPPLTERILRIDPHFNGEYPDSVSKVPLADSPKPKQTAYSPAYVVSGLTPPPFPAKVPPLSVTGTVTALTAETLLNDAGKTSEKKLQYAAGLLEAIPESVTELAQTPLGAEGLVCAMLLGPIGDQPTPEQAVFDSMADAELRGTVQAASVLLADISPAVKIPIAERAYATLKQMTLNEYRRFRSLAMKLIEADGKVDLFELALYAVLIRDLDLWFNLRKPAVLRYNQIEAAADPFRTVLGFIAYAGSDDPAEIQAAFHAGEAVFSFKEPIPSRAVCSAKNFRAGLEQLTEAAFPLRQSILTAVYQCIAADNVITETEGELFRVVCAYFEAPMPMWNLPPDGKTGTN